MRFKGYTDAEDFHIVTLLHMLADWKCWEGGVFLKEWKLEADYIWYDGPLFHLHIGPFWIGLSTH